jgi:GNAT superfamily N-acetyltransferase
MESYITIDQSNIDKEHICCAISDKKCTESYLAKKEWLKKEFENGYVFRRLDARAKVFIEYGPAEKGWAPIEAPGYLLINCFWVSGQYKGKGHGKALLQMTEDDAKAQNKHGLVTVVGSKKFHFMSDTQWLLKQGFATVDTTPAGFSLLAKDIKTGSPLPAFKDSVKKGDIADKQGLVAYYSNRCPYSEFHVTTSLAETAKKRGLQLKTIKINTYQEAQNAPTPASLFSLYCNGRFVTTDISVCMDSRFDKIMGKYKK